MRRRKLTPADLPDLATASVAVVLVRLALWVVPSRILLQRVGERVARAPRPAEATEEVKRLGWAVRAVARRVPRASCLTQALAVQVLLARRGYSSQLRIGVARKPDDAFAAHAWVEIEDAVLVGGTGAGDYRPLPDLSPLLQKRP